MMRVMSAERAAVAIAAAMACAGLLAGCTGSSRDATKPGVSSASAEKMKIGFLVKKPEEKWFQDELRFAAKCAEKYGFELIGIGAENGEKVVSKIDNLGSNGAKGFVICTPDPKLGPAIMSRATKYGMKVIAVDDQFVGADGKLMDVHYMGISARAIGETVGKALAAEYKKRGWTPADTAALAVTFDELNTVKERTDGATAALVASGFPADRIYRAGERTTDMPAARDAASAMITQHQEVKRWLVFSVNDEGVLGAVRALENRGFRADSVIAIGIGGSSAFPEFEKPTVTGFVATVMLSPYRHGYETTESLYKWIAEGKEPPKDVRTAGTLVDRTNYRQVAKEQGVID